MKKLVILASFLFSCSTAPKTPMQACEVYCSVSGSSVLEDKDNACICKTDVGVRVSAGSCLSRANDQSKAIKCLQIAKERCADKEVKLVDPVSICDFINALSNQGVLQ